MKSIWISLSISALLFSCQSHLENQATKLATIHGTWELIDAINKEEGKTYNTFVEGRKMIKIITPSHFSFVNHDLNKGQDSTAFFAAGTGRYTLQNNKYIEQLEFCTARAWEGHVFEFEVELKGDTLVQQGVEKSEKLGVDRYIIETYVRRE